MSSEVKVEWSSMDFSDHKELSNFLTKEQLRPQDFVITTHDVVDTASGQVYSRSKFTLFWSKNKRD